MLPRSATTLDGGATVTRAIASRLSRIEGQFGWRFVTLKAPDGTERTVSALLLLDTWLQLMMTGKAPDLPPDVSRFMASARLRPTDGEFLLGLRDACRDVWFPEWRRTQAQRDEAALRPDPPAPVAVEDEEVEPQAPRRLYGPAHGRGRHRG